MIEAGSLSSLTTLAANPPQYPRNPTEQERSPLILYIARVPGSKGRFVQILGWTSKSSLTNLDVFLSPLKPRQRIVSAQDVESSLYYVHIDRPEDELLLQREKVTARNVEEDRLLNANEAPDLPPRPPPAIDDNSLERTLPRRPVPGNSHGTMEQACSTLPERFPPAPRASTLSESDPTIKDKTLGRKPVGSYTVALPYPNGMNSRLDVDPSLLQPKPLTGCSLPPMPARNAGVFRVPAVNARHALQLPSTMQELPPALPPRHRQWKSKITLPQTGRQAPLYRGDQLHIPSGANPGLARALEAAPRPSPPPRSRSYFSQYAGGDFRSSITLIRRDPTSGAQWNVAKISDPPVTEVSSEMAQSRTPKERYKEMGAPMFVKIMTPGYTKFNDVPASSNSSQRDTSTTFECRMYLEGSRNANHRYPHRKSSSHGSVPQDTYHSDSTSLHPDMTERPPDSRPTDKGYAFFSPWGGKCQFSTGGAGRSVTCRHSVPGPNPSVPSTAAIVSELRFNLPPASMVNSTTDRVTKRASAMATLGRPTNVPRFHSEYSTSSTSSVPASSAVPISPILAHMAADDLHSGRSSVDLDVMGSLARLDLSLGQERAGGGFSGKQAKLGKLILWDEGLKMMDLLVAANMALWWRAYDRVS